MSRLVLDIETAGKDWDALDTQTQEYLIKRAETEEEARQQLSLNPLVAEIVAIGILDADTDKGAMYYQAPGIEPLLPFEEQGVRFECGTEREILVKFWDAVKGVKSIITFNGRGFDCPFLFVRSGVHKIKPTRELIPNRFHDTHIDLMDRLSFYGNMRARYSLDMWCRTFGIKSPKGGMKGAEVAEYYRAGRYLEIARYCVRDIFATRELYHHWQTYLKP